MLPDEDGSHAKRGPCLICRSGAARYACPACALPYCSVECFKDACHEECSTAVLAGRAAAGKEDTRPPADAPERPDAAAVRRQMVRILQRLQNFDLAEEGGGAADKETTLGQKSTMGFLGELTAKGIELMSTAEILAHIGPDGMAAFEEHLERASAKPLDEAIGDWQPWWRPAAAGGGSAPPRAPEDLPPLSRPTRARPSEALWSSLVEVLYLYAHSIRRHRGDPLGDADGGSSAFVRDLLAHSRVLLAKASAHPDVLHALRATEAAIAIEGEEHFSWESKDDRLGDVVALLATPSHAMAALGHVHAALQRAAAGGGDDQVRFAAKKAYFYAVWLNDEIGRHADTVDAILLGISSLVDAYRANSAERRTLEASLYD